VGEELGLNYFPLDFSGKLLDQGFQVMKGQEVPVPAVLMEICGRIISVVIDLRW
jgi:hypothetical protein